MKILLVDDSRAMRMLVSSCLRKAGFTGHTIIEADNGEAGAQMVMVNSPDVVISDWNMPQLNGIGMMEKVKAMHETHEVLKMPTFIFISSESTQDMIKEAMDKGASCFITKPFSEEVLQKKLQHIIR